MWVLVQSQLIHPRKNALAIFYLGKLLMFLKKFFQIVIFYIIYCLFWPYHSLDHRHSYLIWLLQLQPNWATIRLYVADDVDQTLLEEWCTEHFVQVINAKQALFLMH
jgi:hypothetical protein